LPATFGLAAVQKMQGKYQAAIKGFKDYLVMNPDTTSSKYKEAKDQIQACIWAMELIKFNDEDLEIAQLGQEVNTEFSEFAPVQFQDKLFFSSLRFTTASNPLDLGLTNDNEHTAHIAFNKAEDQLFFNICSYSDGNKIQCKIYTRIKSVDNTWGKAIILPESINVLNKTTTQPASDRIGGKGGLDLWMAYIEADGQFSTPTNLTALNTDKDDLSPFFHNYTQTLYFSSNGQKSLGGHDVYKTTLQNEEWQEIIHTGFQSRIQFLFIRPRSINLSSNG